MRRISAVLFALLTVLGLATAVQSGTANAATAHTPVVFVHGFTGSASNWTTAESVFIANGYSSGELFAYQYDWTQSNKNSAAGLATFVKQVLARTGAQQVDIVNHSMGGLVSDWYIKELGGQPYVRHLASIAGANHGTTYAGSCLVYTSCVEMYPGSSFITTVTSGDETPGSTAYATWYSPCDGIIIPYTSTELDGAANHLVPCVTHIGYLTDTPTLTAVERFVNS
ncbi:alpha/beta hydrolase [Streptomyces cocklensis]|uniref:Triacylglycerol lipase n=1 Tax=Actinacidiphila cocklensis TaxID=887465 RepID=A0A9W4DL14_9ACTN|nr:alpha/beta fold hydrolase [Actinacidiphila cocklensis]MDD1062524.1 alpha/beta hydrolase [Actinacidiphila cocklensis]WSX72462.1 alpha/beta hydrolase [Streptomyces sp. NBC_00899]WSX81469.1 alpha/beta hydrolase [Streptomyces sp. NBC_00899]CAG6391930.1 Triacylglycerol lipase [Actinacidiphila cocklensis]